MKASLAGQALWLAGFCLTGVRAVKWPSDWPDITPGASTTLQAGGPQPVPFYMKDNVNNQFGVAPDKGTLDGPVTTEANLTDVLDHKPKNGSGAHVARSASDSSWVDNLSQLGQMPLAPSGYTFFRNVHDFGAKGDGTTDDTMAINNAISSGNRCGAKCGSTTTLGAVIYFPAGTYLISTPIIQYFYTQFIGDPASPPIIRGSKNFTGIALIDTDLYIPGGSGSEWFINQNNFFRSIRNFNLDLTNMNATNYDNGQQYFPTGIHWQIAQATSLQNIGINMATSTDATHPATGVGIFMENGSGGMISDVVIYGGNIGFVAGSQQFTVRGLTFTNCLTAINMLWNWGFTWSQISIDNTYVGFNVSSNGGSTGQGTGSIAIIDSVFTHVEYGITTHAGGDPPAIILQNVTAITSPDMVLVSGGATTLQVDANNANIGFWASGYRYIAANGSGSDVTGYLSSPPVRPASLIDPAGEYFWQDRPLYASLTASSFVAATQHGISNAGTGDQTAAINSLLSGNVGTPIFFPAGIYQVQGTVQVPVGSIIVGSAWSQIMGTGSYFGNAANPQVMVRVGNPGDSGVIQISDMLFTVKGPTAGAILMEWNVHESTQGSAAMWDSHFRVGGAAGTDLQLANCPTGSGVNQSCVAASMMLHLTPKSSGYFENVWAWVADHDLDNAQNALITEGTDGVPANVHTDVSVYGARGILIESQGPCWFYGTASEHSTLYQYELSEASNIYFGHVQTETPYYQPVPTAPQPFTPGVFPSDPDFSNCTTSSCEEAWAMRVVDSSNVMIYSAGFYSWFTNYGQSCLPTESCQQRIFSVEDSSLIWVFNLFTKGTTEIASTLEGPAILTNLPFAEDGGNGGGDFGAGETSYVDPGIWGNPTETVGCAEAPCTLLFPPLDLPTPITVTWPPYATGLYSLSGSVTITITTTISIPPFVVSSIPFWPVTIMPNDPSTGTIIPIQSIMPPSTMIVLPPGEAPISVTDGTVTPDVSGTTSSTSTPLGYFTYTPLPGTFAKTSSTITIQPMPTISIPIPPGDTPSPTATTSSTKGTTVVGYVTSSSHPVPYTHSNTGTSPHCTPRPIIGPFCGSGNCLFGCNGGCGLFGCGGGCGIFGCGGGGCGLFGCGGGGWNLGGCGPAGCGCGLGCGNGGEGEGGGGCNGPSCDNDNPDDECEGDDCECEPTKTVTSCRVICTATAQLTTTITGSCTTSTCEVTSCGTDTTVTSTTTTTQEETIVLTAFATETAWTEDTTDAFASTLYSEFVSWWVAENSAIDAATTTSTTTTPACAASSTPWPTNTLINTGSGYCFNANNAPNCNSQPYKQFSQTDAENAVGGFCDASYVLQPSAGPVSYSATDNGMTIYAVAQWADNQSGCGTEKALDFSNTGCDDGWDTDFFCVNEDGSETTSYGGGYVYVTQGNEGCVLLTLYAH